MNTLTILTDPILLVDLPDNENYFIAPKRPTASKTTLAGSKIRQVGEFDVSTAEFSFTVLVSRELADSVVRAYEETASCTFTDERGAYQGLFHPVSKQSAAGGLKRLLTLEIELVRVIA